MEGPTPVSALIHSSTMVTAGVFLLIRCCPLLEMSNQALFFITIIGALTAFFAASVAIVHNDSKNSLHILYAARRPTGARTRARAIC